MEAGGRLHAAERTVVLPRVFGFCGGVRNAVRALERLAREARPRPCWLLGELIHNPTVTEYFQELGVRIVAESDLARVFEVADPADRFVIPAFGIPKELAERLYQFAESADRVTDTTCGYVTRIWRFAGRMSGEGRSIVLHGKSRHPETLATLSRSRSAGNAVVVVEDLAEAEALAVDLVHAPAGRAGVWFEADRWNPRRLAVLNQTTMLFRETLEIEQVLRAAVENLGGELQGPNTVCPATQERQDAAVELCRRGCRTILVVGGYNSSNTGQLYGVAAEHAPTYFIRDAQAFDNRQVRHWVPEDGVERVTWDWLPATGRIGVLAGASCPAGVVGDVVRKLVPGVDSDPRR